MRSRLGFNVEVGKMATAVLIKEARAYNFIIEILNVMCTHNIMTITEMNK